MTFVAQIPLTIAEKLKSDLIHQGFELSFPPYTLFQGKKKALTCTLYTSGKLTVQGKASAEFIQFYLEPEILGTFSHGYEALDMDLSGRIGVDESGKGDFFGPLCIAGVYAEGDSVKRLVKLGVKDSKTLQESTILKLAEAIRKEFIHHIVIINPLKYNELYEKFGNLNLLLGWGHATVIENMLEKSGCKKVIIDKFAAEHVVETALRRKNKEAFLTQRTKAEADPVVAAASILARATFVKGLERLCSQFDVKLPKGASAATIAAGKKIVSEKGKEILPSLCKLHFKTITQL